MSNTPSSLASSILGFALMLLLAGWAINTAVHLILEVWPYLVALAVCVTAASLATAYLRRDRW